MSASLDQSGTLEAKGTLRTQTGQPVSQALINLAVDGKLFTAGMTRDDGSWSASLRLPSPMQNGPHELLATFDGATGVGAASVSGTFSMPPQPTLLTAAAKPMTAAPGALLNVTGKAALFDHRPVADSHVAIVLGDDGQAALTTPTDPQGNYQAVVPIPLDAPHGPFNVTVKLVDSRYGASQQTITVQVASASPSPTPTPSLRPTPSTPTPSSPTPTTSEDGRIPMASSSPIPVAHRSVLDSFGGRKPLLILAIVIGVLLLGVLLGSFTRHRGDKGSSEGDGNSLFDDWDGPSQR
ncbi:hypothetical protein FYJ43_10070 [Cutibacterium sp. WCA-380-WT-3A]|uniref:Bacterial Ig-like domain-containing protein n=1 Tax=Cutibacterium porci TaxID=2605781 RepID=A0A7K0J8T0_9ACTN|nr:hypothetical protein [Cutibacterium porci]MSS46356.1 hypothetical protein [Cutibacterium porci]